VDPSRIAWLQERLDALEHELATVKQLAARAAERADGWRFRLAELRTTPEYAAAFSGDPLVTVRIGTYQGAEQLVERALASVRRQTYANWEAVVVGDGCHDETGERVRALGDGRIRFRDRPFNGPYVEEGEARWLVAGSYPFNEAAEDAAGDWIAPIDQDDEWTPDHIETLLRAAQQNRAELAYGVMGVVIEGSRDETWFGTAPPRAGDFGFQAALYHAGLRQFAYDPVAYLVGEPADWNLARRMLEAGVRFWFVERRVGTYHASARGAAWWRERARERGAFPE
jgi:glycosyltransferase involved in cell wall biosynthesis